MNIFFFWEFSQGKYNIISLLRSCHPFFLLHKLSILVAFSFEGHPEAVTWLAMGRIADLKTVSEPPKTTWFKLQH